MSWLKRHLPKRRWKRVCIYLFSIFALLLAADMLLVQYWRRIKISPETTRIISPLRADGMPDYIAARNSIYSQGVTFENNAAPDLFTIVGTEAFPKAWREEIFPGLRMSAESSPPRFISYWDWLEKHQPIFGESFDANSANGPSATQEAAESARGQEYDETHKGIWKSSDHPKRWEWLKEQQEALTLLHLALMKDRFYVPWRSFSPLENTPAIMPWITGARNCSHLLAADAMRAAGDGRADIFQRDVIDMSKLARLVGQGSTLLEYLVAVAVDDEASLTIQRSSTVKFLDAQTAGRMLQAWAASPRLHDESAVLDSGERFYALNTLCQGSTGSLRAAMGGSGPSNVMQELLTPIHYNGALRTFNHYFDELVASYRLPSYPQRAAASKAISDESVNSRNWFSMGDLLVAIAMPSLGKTLEVQERTFVDHDLATLSLALRAFHEAHGNYPADLAALQPGILAAIPFDGFNDAPLHYRRDGQGYLLYSVGPDGQDDGGTDRKHAKAGKWDIVVKTAD